MVPLRCSRHEQLGAHLARVVGAGDGVADGLVAGEDLKVVAALQRFAAGLCGVNSGPHMITARARTGLLPPVRTSLQNSITGMRPVVQAYLEGLVPEEVDLVKVLVDKLQAVGLVPALQDIGQNRQWAVGSRRAVCRVHGRQHRVQYGARDCMQGSCTWMPSRVAARPLLQMCLAHAAAPTLGNTSKLIWPPME